MRCWFRHSWSRWEGRDKAMRVRLRAGDGQELVPVARSCGRCGYVQNEWRLAEEVTR